MERGDGRGGLTHRGAQTGVACIYIITLEAFALALVASLFLLGLVWSCTRPWAAALLLSLALGGIVLCPTGNGGCLHARAPVTAWPPACLPLLLPLMVRERRRAVLLVMVFLASSLAVYLLYFHVSSPRLVVVSFSTSTPRSELAVRGLPLLLLPPHASVPGAPCARQPRP